MLYPRGRLLAPLMAVMSRQPKRALQLLKTRVDVALRGCLAKKDFSAAVHHASCQGSSASHRAHKAASPAG